jgi:hypothetical protein
MPFFSLVAHKHHYLISSLLHRNLQQSSIILSIYGTLWKWCTSHIIKLTHLRLERASKLEVNEKYQYRRQMNKWTKNKHCDIENFILTSVCTWQMGIRWSTPDLHSHHRHLRTCPIGAPKSIPHPRRNWCKVYVASRWQFPSQWHKLQITSQPGAS